MITTAILTAFLGTAEFLIGLFPLDPVEWPEAQRFGIWAGAIVGPLNALLPVAETAAVTALTVTVVLPVLLVYWLAMWLWTLLPIPGGGS